MKYAGLMKPPALLTQEVYEHILSQVATNYIKAFNRKIRQYKKHREVEEARYEPLLNAIADMRYAVENSGTRDIYNKYKGLRHSSRVFFGSGYIMDLNQKSFSGVKDPERRKRVKELVEENIKRNLEAMENRLSYGEDRIPEIRKDIKAFKSLITVKLKAMKKGEVRKVSFPIFLDEWYVDQQSLEDHLNEVTETKRNFLNEWIKDIGRTLDEEVNGERDAEINKYLKEHRDRLVERAENLEDELLNLREITVSMEVSSDNPSWNARDNVFFMPLYDVDRLVDSGSAITEPQRVANRVFRTVTHEMTHAGQTILSYISLKIHDFGQYVKKYEERTLSGFPSKKIRTPQYSQHGKGQDKSQRHHLDDVEFYTDLRDGIREIMEYMKIYERRVKSDKNKRLLFKALVGADLTPLERRKEDWIYGIRAIPYFISLKRKAKPKYEKAVGEAYKLVFNSFEHQRMAKRVSSKYIRGLK